MMPDRSMPRRIVARPLFALSVDDRGRLMMVRSVRAEFLWSVHTREWMLAAVLIAGIGSDDDAARFHATRWRTWSVGRKGRALSPGILRVVKSMRPTDPPRPILRLV